MRHRRRRCEMFGGGAISQAPIQTLRDVRFEFTVHVQGDVRVELHRRSAGDLVQAASTLGLAAVHSLHESADLQAPTPSHQRVDGVVSVVPAGALHHISSTSSAGHPHRTTPVNRRTRPEFILDVERPIQFDARPHRCTICQNLPRPLSRDDDDLPVSSLLDDEKFVSALADEMPRECDKQYWAVVDEDIRRVFPGVIICRPARSRVVYMTPMFLLEVCQQFYGCINARQLRRQLAAVYSASALALQCRQHRSGHAPYSLAWQISALPRNRALRAVVLRGFSSFLIARARAVRRLQLLYNGQGLRHDGCFWLAKVLITPVIGGKATVVIAFCGVDGSLLHVPVPVRSESWKCIEAVLRPLLEERRDVLMAAGMTATEACPVFHATDVFHKHAPALARLYAEVFNTDIQVRESSAKRRRIRLVSTPTSAVCTPCGEPFHDIINMRKLVSPMVNDAYTFKADYEENIYRFSLEDPPADGSIPTEPEEPCPPLPRAAKAFLQQAIQQPRAVAEQAWAQTPATATAALVTFVRHSHVRDSPIWLELFGAAPTRGALARVARLVGAELHMRNHAFGWCSKEELRREMLVLKRWYKPGRRVARRRIGMLRGPKGEYVRGRATVWTAKLNAHWRRLLKKTRLAGMWRWRKVARALRSAGIAVHSGTVPVERLWAQFKEAFPPEARRMKRPWWDLLATLCFLRFTYLHFNGETLPGFCEGDSLLAERIDGLVALTRVLHADAAGDGDALRALRAAFQ